MTFIELAELVLQQSDRPLTANEIWSIAEAQRLAVQLNSKGSTPWATLAAQIYVSSRDNPNSKFRSVGKRPKRFYLKGKQYAVNFEEYEAGKPEEEEIVKPRQKTYLEKHLHPFLAHFAFFNLRCYTKTIDHTTSSKSSYGEWVHPDMVGCVFPIDEWEQEVLELSSAIGNTSIRLMAFEIKRELNLSTLREKFFQTVSNASWANESYLVAAEISHNDDFLNELARLSSSFGIGVIQLDLDEPNSSRIIFPARKKEYLDWETINKLTMNKDFKQFLKRVKIDVSSNEIRKEKYDKVLTEEQLGKLVKVY